MILSECAIYGSKKSKFIKEQQAKGLLSNLGIRTPLQNEVQNEQHKFLLAGDTFIPEMHLRQPHFTYSACGPFTKHKQRIQKFKETGDTNYIYKNE